MMNTLSGILTPARPPSRGVAVWLLTVFAMVGAMVVVGGITRLTGSGLSMVEWHPLMGALPPLSEQAWLDVFAQYQGSPQYQQVNSWMTLADFQRIFFWEYLHRLLGRTIGLVFFVPFVWFWARKKLTPDLLWRSWVAFLLGGAQGLLGWFMVKSGLVDVPEVSHLRLAAHLSLAFFVGMWVWWMAAGLLLGARRPSRPLLGRWLPLFTIATLAIQIVYGAFMAGTRAGRLYQTFPDMNGEYLPSAAFIMDGLWTNLLENPVFIHVFHRSFAWVVFVLVLALAAQAWRRGTGAVRFTAGSMVGLLVVQIVLGALTVMRMVPVTEAVLHQGVAYLLLASCVLTVQLCTPPAGRTQLR